MNVGKRVVQLAKIGLAARKVAKARNSEDKQLAHKALANLFADAKGVTMKVGQFLADPAGDDAFADLVESIAPVPLSEIRPVIAEHLGAPVDDIFPILDESMAAASLGQVHHAQRTDGQEVAVKVRYPGIADAVEAELKLAGLMPGVGPVKKWGFNFGGYKTTLKDNMDRELDYRSEAARQMRFRDTVRVPGLVIPQVHEDLSGPALLVQDWHEGARLKQIIDWPQGDRKAVGRILLSTLFASLFEAGEVHGDPHPGNAFYRRDGADKPEVVLLDYGCTIAVDELPRLALLKLILGLREGEDVSPLQAFAAMGFEAKKLSLIAGALPMLSVILLHPFLDGGPMFVSHWKLKDRFEALLGDNRWWFRSAGPASNFLLMRAFQGVVQQLDLLRASLNWWDVLQTSVSPETLAAARALVLPPLPDELLNSEVAELGAGKAAQHLKVKVLEGGREKVALSMPAEAALDLESLIPEDVVASIRATGETDLEAVAADIRRLGLQPQEILDFDKGDKNYRVWLE